ncbi:hypothetical protein Dimus_031815, partial [Dionaea muscipula]
EKIEEKKSVKRKTVRKKGEEQKSKVEEKVPVSDHKEPRTKHKHDKNANEDELLSEMLYKAKKTKQATKKCEELRQQAKRKGDSRGVNPSAEKRQKSEKKKDEKQKEKEVFFDSSDSENEGLMVKALPIDLIWRKRVIRSNIVREGWMKDNGLSNVMELIKRTKWENLFKRRELVHVDSVKEFHARMTVILLKKKDVVKSSVKGVAIEFDHVKLASVLGVPGKNGIFEYIKDVWEESKYMKPLEITRRFANDETLTAARRVKSGKMKPFQRFIHFLVMKNVVPRFGKRDTLSFMDLTYMDHLMSRRLVNLPRVMMRHLSYVISMKDHELSYGDWLTMVFEEFGVPLVDKKGEEPKRTDYFEENFLTMCKMKREDGVWWIGSGENRRRDDVVDAPEEETEEEEDQTEFDWEAVIDEVTVQGESGSDDQFFDAQVDVEEPVTKTPAAPAVPVPSTVQQKVTKTTGVDPSCPSGCIPEAVMNKLQAKFERAIANRIQADLEKAQAENARLLAMLQQAQFKPKL